MWQMPEAIPQTLILAVPGTQETHTLDIESIRAAVARGEIALDNWAWSPARNEWLPLVQVPEYAEAPVAPPAPVVEAVPAPVAVVAVPVASVVQPAASAQAAPVRVAMPAQAVAPQAVMPTGQRKMAATYYSKPIEEHREFPLFKILFTLLGLLIAALIGMNYFMVDQPFRAALAKTAFSNVQAHAHLGAFAQPNVLLIHIMPTAQLNDDNFADFLTALAQSAPRSVIAGKPIDTLGLTSEWFSQYIITSDDWDGFADMSGYSAEQKKHYVLIHLESGDGTPFYVVAKNQDAATRQAREDALWKQLVTNFSGKSG
jgi:hypothetical protein